MSGVKHTPGRWKLDVVPSGGSFGAAGGRAYGVSSTNALGLSVPVVVWRGIARPASPEGQANARLIAAAPDLLEAGAELQAARKVQNADPSAANALRVRRASDAFDAALARARGEQDGGGE